MSDHRILELYSGIGGMHCAWNAARLPGTIAAAVDINTVANEVYKNNFKSKVHCRNIQAISLEEFKRFKADTILMSPPCQPFTRNGKYLDLNDARTKSFLYLLDILKNLEDLKYILLENVKGFETSEVRDMFVKTLDSCEFDYQEFLLSPTTVGDPNSRLRYYCIARKKNTGWNFEQTNEIIETLSNSFEPPYKISEIMEKEVDNKFLVPNKFLKRANIFDICHKDSDRSCCFTKAYTHYVEGTGSIYTNSSLEFLKMCLENANRFEAGSEQFLDALKPLNLRYFTPKEVLALMSFPRDYKFPDTITLKQCYRLLGNSVNVKVISELLKLLYL